MKTIEAPRGGYVLVRIPGEWGKGVRLYLGRAPVTNEEYQRYVLANVAQPPRYWHEEGFDDPREPVVGVTWLDAMAYCRWAGLRLPTEAQWEHACLEGSPAARGTLPAAALDRVAWYAGSSEDRRRPVGGKAADRLGLYDMLGNVWEWCLDEVEADERDFTVVHSVAPHDDPNPETQRVVRGGSWRSVASLVTAKSRFTAYDRQCGPDIGFRPLLIERPR